ncbi:STICHEL-like 3 [Olea europaea subsp. europaea]|uniref:STICHEL-like 3 n=1 Tax=Olea europaea subsp. europaea TaxID=158383 RepID=A0A8S0U4Y0_OLEEU|nr:STICHEL-like 3 [Olea europaea subsp. europaea]
MTRAVRDRILKDVNGNISDHLRNHIHLTNCIHLKNHMHKHSPILADRALMRDLVVLQRSRSLRDPSTSPPSWRSPTVDVLLRTGEREAMVNGRRSIGIDRPREGRGIEIRSPPIGGQSIHVVSRHNDQAVPAVSNHTSKSVIRERRRGEGEESSGRFLGNDVIDWSHEHLRDSNDIAHDRVSGHIDSRDKNIKHSGRNRQDVHLKTLSDQLNEFHAENDDGASSHNHGNGKNAQIEKNDEAAGTTAGGYKSGLNRAKRRKFRGARRTRATVASQDAGAKNEMSVASNSFAQGGAHQKYQMEKMNKEHTDQTVTGIPRNGCGIPWNWSRIHHRGKSFLDLAGRSLSCGLSDSRVKIGSSNPQGRDIHDRPVMSEHSSSSTKSDAEALPLLLDASESQGSMGNAAWLHDYSGELGIYADNLLKQEVDMDLVSEGRSGEQHKFRRHRNGRHQNLTQKYMPRTFRDLVGQNLVAQALSNAVFKRKVGLLYVFYGPHGTGKTSSARIFAKALNCQSLENPKPCGFCNPCVAYDVGKSRNIREMGSVSNFDFETITDLLDNMILSQLPSQYRVLIFDECDTLSHDCWNAILKVIDRAPRRVIFILISSSLDVLPHIIISRCQKFFFPKLKDADIIYTLQWISMKEDLEIDKDALKLIASRSDGSLRDAEMTLEQLSLLGQRISVPLVQELVGLISDEKLVDLLDLALSADTVNTVKNLREIMESGIEPLALMSQLATVITDILAGSYDFMKERPRRKFFRRQALSKEDMEKLRQALKTLSEAEKQLRMSNDKITWLTAALLQLAPDQQYMLRSSSTDTSLNHSPPGLSNVDLRDGPRKSNVRYTEVPNFQAGSIGDIHRSGKMKGIGIDRVSQQGYSASEDKNKATGVQLQGRFGHEIEEIWLDVLHKIPINSIKEFLYQEGKLISVSFGAAPTVQLMFSSPLTKSKAEKFKEHILQAFESVLRSLVTIEIRCESSKNVRGGPIMLPASQEISSRLLVTDGMPRTGHGDIRSLQQSRDGSSQAQFDTTGMGRTEIVEVEASPREPKGSETKNEKAHQRNMRSSFADRKKLGERNQSLSLVRGKVSLAHVIQQAERCSQQSGWSKRKAVSIAEKLEQENLRLEPRSRGLLCWNVPRVTRRKLSRLKIRTRKPKTLLKFVSCGRCLPSRSPR